MHVLHREEDVAGVLALVEHRHHVRVRQPGRRLGLADEPGDELVVVGEYRVHHLDGDDALQPGVESRVDRGHAPAGDARLHPVTAVEQPSYQRV
jgi:hypothetical protein